jgi:hypothetical protein
VLSHLSAAAHWGLLQSDATRTDVTTRGRRAGNATIRLHRSHTLIARDTTTRQGIPITSVARTLLDLAATVRSDRLERALAQAENLELYDHLAITDLLVRANGHRGMAALAEATALEPKLTSGEWEVRFLELVRAAGLPEPLVNLPLDAPDHGPCRPDFHWPSHRLIVETDGWKSHKTRAAFESDRAKDALLTPARTRPPHGSPVR